MADFRIVARSGSAILDIVEGDAYRVAGAASVWIERAARTMDPITIDLHIVERTTEDEKG